MLVEDYLSGAFFGALAAACAFCVIYRREIVFDVDRIKLTSLFAELTADTAYVASLSCVSALLSGRALDDDGRAYRNCYRL